MRQIKFRGRNWKGELVYGSYCYTHFTDTDYAVHAIIDEYGEEWSVAPDDVAQFVGVDKNGVEVYEGDKLIDDPENEFTAEIYMRPEQIERLILR